MKHIGYQKIALLALILYAVRFVGFTLLSSPELFLILELLKPFCSTLLYIAVFAFVRKNSPLTIAATIEHASNESIVPQKGIDAGIFPITAVPRKFHACLSLVLHHFLKCLEQSYEQQ